MIIFRYFLREILFTTFAVCTVLLLILVSGRLVKYLAEVAASAMDPSIMIAMLGYRIPAFLELVLPLAFFLGLLLTLGRMNGENEITVLYACGFSEKKLFLYVLCIASILAVLVGSLSLFISPSGMAKYDVIVRAQKNRSEIDNVAAKRFYPLREDKGVIYADELSDKNTLKNVFLVMTDESEERSLSRVVMVIADEGLQQAADNASEQYLMLTDGVRVDGVPGNYNYQITDFQEYGIRLADNESFKEDSDVEAMPTTRLFESMDPKSQAALQWRLSLPIMTLVVAFLAWPLSRSKPRQGVYSKLLPGIIIYFTYVLGLNALKGAIESGEVPVFVTLMPLHLAFILIGILLMIRKHNHPLLKIAPIFRSEHS